MEEQDDQEYEDGERNQNKKSRKPYTVSKQRENWTNDEHSKFLEALKLFDRDWKQIEKFIGTKNVIQIRSHAQKYFLKVQKNNTGERIPPPRAKKKLAPTPQKMSPDVTISISWMPGSQDSSSPPTGALPSGFLPNSVASNTGPATFVQWMNSNGLMPNVLSVNPNVNTLVAIEQQKHQQEQLQEAQATLRNTKFNTSKLYFGC